VELDAVRSAKPARRASAWVTVWTVVTRSISIIPPGTRWREPTLAAAFFQRRMVRVIVPSVMPAQKRCLKSTGAVYDEQLRTGAGAPGSAGWA
jgi:hypothetical protein